ncbi:hypothetical protein G2W53_043592 [Senna tora]|uniref:Uncharacterized protein n=1 Tax=Senna tora TaxID=362788 RepID=A0A834SJ01_9FABA|nr:hypothetical protein G2W53_043592 [Senna tora]
MAAGTYPPDPDWKWVSQIASCLWGLWNGVKLKVRRYDEMEVSVWPYSRVPGVQLPSRGVWNERGTAQIPAHPSGFPAVLLAIGISCLTHIELEKVKAISMFHHGKGCQQYTQKAFGVRIQVLLAVDPFLEPVYLLALQYMVYSRDQIIEINQNLHDSLFFKKRKEAFVWRQREVEKTHKLYHLKKEIQALELENWQFSSSLSKKVISFHPSSALHQMPPHPSEHVSRIRVSSSKFDSEVETHEKLPEKKVEFIAKDGIHHPKPRRPKKNTQSGSSEDLSNRVVTQIHAREHSQERQRPCQKIEDPIIALSIETCEVDGKEKRVLTMTGGPAVGIAGLEQRTGVGTSLLDRRLDHFVDELGNEKAESEEHSLELAAKDEMRNEAAEAYEDWDQ